jgi:hypothetical protein
MIENTASHFAARLPDLLPLVLAWAQETSRIILRRGLPLDSRGIKLARAVGVERPERIRILTVAHVPPPDDPELRQLALEQNLIGPQTRGLTLGYGIFIVEGQLDPVLLSHECRHVHQVESAGGLDVFLPKYLAQIADFTYDKAPHELDARAHELPSWPKD